MTSNCVSELCLSEDSVMLSNLKAAAFKMSVEPTSGSVIGIASLNDLLFVSVLHQGLNIYRVDNGGIMFIGQIGGVDSSYHDLLASNHYLTYIKEERSGSVSLCIHQMSLFAEDDVSQPAKSLTLQRRTPYAVQSKPGLLFIAASAWGTSWTTQSSGNAQLKGLTEAHVVAVDIELLEVLFHWKATQNSISMLRTQSLDSGQSMLGVADLHSGITVYDLGQSWETPVEAGKLPFPCLYRIDVEEVRHFELVGACIAVFHRHEPNVSFWNVLEQRTILCINVQEDARKLSEEFIVDNEEDADDCCYVIEDDDHVTSVTSFAIDNGADFLLVYGTVSGCVFGMSVNRRSKVFSIPCPHVDLSPSASFVDAVTFLPSGQLLVAYHGWTGFTVMNFGITDPPNRPPTRCLKRDR